MFQRDPGRFHNQTCRTKLSYRQKNKKIKKQTYSNDKLRIYIYDVMAIVEFRTIAINNKIAILYSTEKKKKNAFSLITN